MKNCIYVLIIVLVCPFLLLADDNLNKDVQDSLVSVDSILFEFRRGVDWKTKERNIEKLAQKGEAVVPILIRCLRSDLPEDLAKRIKESSEGQLRAIEANRSSYGVQTCSKITLVKIGEPAVPMLIESVDKQPETVATVCGILGRIGDERAIPVLITVLRDEHNNFWRRGMAAIALRKLNAKEAIPYLIDALRGQPDDPYNNDKFLNYVADSLAKLSGESFGFTYIPEEDTRGKAGIIPAHYVFAGTDEQKRETVNKWRQWWRKNQQQIDIQQSLTKYGSKAVSEEWPVDPNNNKEGRSILLEQIREFMEKKHIPDAGILSRDTMAKRQEEFEMLLDKLAVATAEKGLAASESDLEKSLIAIAQNYHSDPNLIDELIEDYGSWKGDWNRRPVALRPQALKDKHTTEKYRLAWEALSLAPETEEIRFMEMRIFEALQRIDNPESVPALAEAFRLTTLKNVPRVGQLNTRQTRIIATLAMWPEEKTLTALFTCLELLDEYNEGQAPTKTHDEYTLRHKVFRFITDPDNKGITESEKRRLPWARKWKAVVNEYSIPIKSEKNKQMLEKSKSHTLPDVQN